MVDGWSDQARGGTGTRFPWEEVAEHRNRLSAPLQLIVAGGLGPGNVAEVVTLLDPDVVDVSSGVEQSPGLKDPELIHAFADAVRSARAREGVG
jgi:phosphoribosylanthranilate isomerase